MSPAVGRPSPRLVRTDTVRKEYSDAIVEKIQVLMSEDAPSSIRILNAAITGGETKNNDSSIVEWIENQLTPNLIFIDKAGYTEMCLDALKTLSTQALTDFGTSRQRDFGQAWADKTRGYLGEYAVVKFLKDRFSVETKLAHQQGHAESFYDTDIAEVLDQEEFRSPKINIGIKTTKFNGIWLDVAKEQFLKSDIHVQVKIGGGTTHLFSFFKELSIFKDKILKVGLEEKYLTNEEAKGIWNEIPDFRPIPGYIAGFAIRDEDYSQFQYGGNKARLHYTINSFRGLLPRDYEQQIRNRENMSGGNIKFQSIDKFSSSDRYLFNTGNLARTMGDWEEITKRL